MRKIYSLMALLLVATLGFVAKAATAKVFIDNKAGVYLYTNGDNYDRVEDKLVNGDYVDITFTEGLTWNLDSSDNKTFYKIVRNDEVIAQNISPVFDIGFDFEVADGDIIEIFVNAPSSGMATASVYTDEIQYSLFIYDNAKDKWIDITSQLTPGKTASIEFDPASQSTWNIEGNAKFYSITLDGKTLLSNSTLPGIDMNIPGMKNGSELSILVKDPSAAKSVITVDYGEYGEDAIRYMTLDGDEVEVVDGKFEAEDDAMLLIYPNNLYDIKSIKLGDEELEYIVASGAYVGFVSGDATLAIDAEPKQAKEIALNITSADAVKAFYAMNSWFIGVDEVTGLVDGKNTVKVEPDTPVFDVQVNDGYSVVSATYTDADGKTYDLTYDNWGKFYWVDVFAKNVVSINVETKEKVVEYVTFSVVIENVDVLKAYFIRVDNPREFVIDSDSPAKLLHNGENKITITDEQAESVRFNFEFVGEAIKDITLDGQPILTYDDYDNSMWGDVKGIKNGSVVKIGNPSGITGIAGDAAARKVYNMQGIEVKADNLPAGLYIINGKKTYVK